MAKLKNPRVVGIAAAALVVAAGGGFGLVKWLETRTESPQVATTTAQTTSAGEGSASEVVVPTFAELAPALHLDGEDGIVPQGVRIVLARPIVSPTGFTAGQAAAAGTKLTFAPTMSGKLMQESPTSVLFVPDKPFAYGTSYTATLSAIEAMGQVVEGGDQGISRVFETPAFELKRVSLGRTDDAFKQLSVELVFTGAPDTNKVGDFVRFTANGKSLKASMRTGRAPNISLAVLDLAQIGDAKALELTLKQGAPATHFGAKTANAQNQSVELYQGEEVEIKVVRLKEGVGGFYFQIVCTDNARLPDSGTDEYANRIYYYDSESSDGMYVSDRCVLDDAAAQSRIRFDPAVKFSLVPSRGGFRILGDFKPGELSLAMDAGIPSTDGGVLKSPFYEKFSVPHRKPQASFVAQGRYLPRKAWQNLKVRHLNVENATLTMRVVPLENLIFWLSADSEVADDRTSSLVATKELKLSGAADEMTTTNFDMSTIVQEAPHGIIELSLKAEGADTVDRKRLITTSLNLVAKMARSGQSVTAWTLDMDDASPVTGAQLKLITKSGRVLSECTTASNGCELKWNADQQVDKSPPFALLATKGEDATYLKFSELKTEISEQLIQGRPFTGGETPYRAALFSDRGAYRPGETAHVSGIVRGADDAAPPAGMPVEMQLVDPRDKVLRKQQLTTNEAGFLTTDLTFETFANTGRYTVNLYAGGANLGQYQFNVEEFVPERMKVEVVSAANELKRGDEAKFTITASYLFGGSAEGSRVELNCEVAPGDFVPKENASYKFGVWYPDQQAPKAMPLGAVSGVLDADGKVELNCPLPEQGGLFAGPAKVVAKAAVFEGESGRSSQSSATVPMHPTDFYIGLSSGQTQIKQGDTLTFQGLLVDWQGKLVPRDATIEVELIRLETEYDWSFDDDSGGSGVRRYLRQASEGRSSVQVKGGKFQGEFKIAQGGAGFVVRARLNDARTDLNLKGDDDDYYWYWGESSRDQTPRPFKPTWLDLVGPDLLKKGKDATFKFTAPFKGRVLLTMETDEIVKSEWRDVGAGPVEWTVSLDKFRPNVFVSAFLVKDPHLESKDGFLPDRAFGVQTFRVEPEGFGHALKLETPGEIRSNSTLTVDLDLGEMDGQAYAVVAAVDEGILSLTRFKTPDPLRKIFEARALGIETFETIGWNVMLPGAGPASSTGGDGAGGDGPIALIKPVALFSGVISVPKSGKLSVSLEVPQYRGQLRVMAVTVDRRRIGSAEASVFVRDPLVVQTTLPRFLTEGDQFNVPVQITNMTGKAQKVKVALEAKSIEMGGDMAPADAVTLVGGKETTIPLSEGQSQTVVFRAETRAAVGGASFHVVATAESFESREDLEVPILSAKPRTRVMKRLEASDGKMNLLSELDGWMPTTEKSNIWVTANPYGDVFGHLRHLINYPYGCIEQTTSTTRPLLVLRDLLMEADPGLLPAGTGIEDMAKKGIERVLSMQTASGGFSYWPGSEQPTAWGTAYGTHMLLDAQKLGYTVPKERLDEALSWLQSQITNNYRYVADREDDEYYDLRQAVSYMHYVLALAGKGLKGDMDKEIARIEKKVKGKAEKDSSRLEQLYTLKAGLYLAGDRRYEGDLRMPDISPITSQRDNDWSFYSDLRRRGFMLSVFTDLFGADPAGEKLANLVADRLRTYPSRWYTTQELVWAVTGLGKFVSGGSSGFDAKLLVNGKSVKPKAEGKSWLVPRASEKQELVLDIDKKDQKRLFVLINSDGVRQASGQSDGVKVGGEGLKLSRTYRKSDGSSLDPESEVTLGSVIYTEITIENTGTERVANVALVDRFPAAWEVENPRLGRGTAVDFINTEEVWDLAYMNIRDDRIEVFGTLRPRETRKVYYASRAVVSGRFQIPPVEAEAMYDPRIWAREAGGKTNVKGPWKEFAGQ